MQITNCLCCGTGNLEQIIDLGNQVPANSFRTNRDEKQETFPLRLVRCTECSHIQIDYAVDPAILYRNYSYRTSISSGLKTHLDTIAVKIPEKSKVLEIGCNDCYLLKKLKNEKNCEVLGVDPALTFAEAQEGVDIIRDLWSTKIALGIEHNYYDYIIATNVIGHLHNPAEGLAACRLVLSDTGKIIIEVHYAGSVVLKKQFDTIYHEHISYFTIKSITKLAASVNLFVHDVEHVDNHGGSIRVTLSKQPNTNPNSLVIDSVWLLTDSSYRHYKDSVDMVLHCLSKHISNDTIGFCASARFITAIQTFDLNLKAVIDETPTKIGKYIANTNTQVLNSDALKDCSQILNGCWNYYDIVKRRLSKLVPNSTLVSYYPSVQEEFLNTSV